MAMLVGCGTMLATIVVQGALATLAVEVMGSLLAQRLIGVSLVRNFLATVALVLALLIGHLAQVALWAIIFMAAGEFTELPTAFYHSAVNYTTLGYGDIIMSARWRLLGPLEAASGVLAFGWSTAVIVAIVMRLARTRQLAQMRRPGHPAG